MIGRLAITVCRRVAAATGLSMLLLAIPAHAFLDSLFGTYPAYDKDAKASWLEQLDTRNKWRPVPAPDPQVLEPYKQASLGAEVAYTLAEGTNLVSAPEAQALCQRIVDQLLGGWKGEKPAIRVLITGDASYGALATHLNTIQVHIGTFNTGASNGATPGVESDDELAMLLAHELSHLLLLHDSHLQDWKTVESALSIIASGYANREFLVSSQLVGDQLVNTDAGARLGATAYGQALSTFFADVLEPFWNTSSEFQADMLGFDLARRAGFAVGVEEATRFIQKHAESLGVRTQRMDRLVAVISQLVLFGKKNPANTNKAERSSTETILRSAAAAAIPFVAKRIATLTKDHPEKAERLAALDGYISARYGEDLIAADGSLLKHSRKGVGALAKSATLTSLVRSTTSAHALRDLLSAQSAAQLAAQVEAASTPQNSAPETSPSAPPPSMDSSKEAPASPVAAANPKTKATKSKARKAEEPKAAPAPAPPDNLIAIADPSVPDPQLDAAPSIPTAQAAPLLQPVRMQVALPCGGAARMPMLLPPDIADRAKIAIRNFPDDNAPFTWSVHGDWQETRPQCQDGARRDWTRSLKSDYVSLDALRHFTLNAAKTPDEKMLPALYERLVGLFGTDRDFPDLAVAVSIAKHDPVTAERKAAECFEYRNHELYATCVLYLGYDPADDKAGGAKTPDGKLAFAHKTLKATFGLLFKGVL